MSSLRPQSATAFTVSTVWDKPERELRSAALDNAEPELVKPAAVLIADGNAGERHALGELVREKHGAVSLIHAADGAEALAALRRHEIGIALVDRCLRGLDGAEFLKELRSSARSVMLALLSDRLVPQWAKVAWAIGAHDVLLKPVNARQIGNLLTAYSHTCRPANVLVVEPSPKTLDLVAGMLRKSVFRLNLDLCDTAQGALRALVPEFYDVAVLNMALPDANGIETAFRLLSRSPSTRVVVYGLPNGYPPKLLKQLGIAAHLRMPFEPHELELALHDAMGLWRPYLLKAIGRVEKLDQGGVDSLFR
jgi:DNA-binding response OmpR family regulator